MVSAADADKKKEMHIFNCTQRAHANFLENQPSVIAAMLISGLQYPLTSASMGAVWIFGRIVYALGYASRNPKNVNGRHRMRGMFLLIPQFGVYIMSVMTAYNIITA